MTKLSSVMFDGIDPKQTVEREVIERHRGACDLCGWRGEWREASIGAVIVPGRSATTGELSSAILAASADLGMHAFDVHGTAP